MRETVPVGADMGGLVGLLSAVAGLALTALLLGGQIQAAFPRAAPLDLVINEVAWGGTAYSANHEWIELYNNTTNPIDLAGWTLISSDGSPDIALTGTIPPRGYYLLERVSDCTVSDLPADEPPYSGVLGNSGERLELRDEGEALIDSADGSGGWPAGSGSPGYYTMERVDPAQPDQAHNWASNDGSVRNGLDCGGGPLQGTPKARNSARPWPAADLSVGKRGPPVGLAGGRITYTILLSNTGQLPAQTVRLTDLLPAELDFLAQDAPYSFAQPVSGTLVWNLGTIPAAADVITFTVVSQVREAVVGSLTNVVTATCATTEPHLANNHAAVVTVVGRKPLTPAILIEALYYDGYEPNDLDEAVRVQNVSTTTADVGGWQLTDGVSTAIFPPATGLDPGQSLWCARAASAFARQFGFAPDLETGDTDPAVPEMAGSWPGFANDGDECLLSDEQGKAVDTMVYKGGDISTAGWTGAAVEPWSPSSTFGGEGQILYRKRRQATGLPVPDTDTAADWAQDPHDQTDGRRVLYPGWDLDDFFFTQRVTETATITLAIAPDNLYKTVVPLLAGARERIQIESYTFRSLELADVLLDRLAHGVSVTLLLEGAPPFEGVTDQQKWIAGQLHAGGAQVLYMAGVAEENVPDRYGNLHAKFLVIDDRLALIGSENLSYTGMPADPQENGTAGRRGVYAITDAPGVVARAQAILAADGDAAHHLDLLGCDDPPYLCTPPVGFQPAPTPDWMTYTVRFPAAATWYGTFGFEVVQSPENSLRSEDGLLGLLGRAGMGDTILVEQLSEPLHWGSSSGSPESDPNLRLATYLAASRRGASVRILLDRYLDQSGDNAATAAYLQAAAEAEGLDLEVRLANPTYLGLHNKMILVHLAGRGYIHVGSLNGGEASSKINRELALQIQADDAYRYLETLFEYDWHTASPPVWLPLAVKSYRSLQPADHLLVSEIRYTPAPENEWVEIYNPTDQALDLSAYKLGDAAQAENWEGMYQFPPGTTLTPHTVLVIAVTARDFHEEFPGLWPDLEILDTDPAVPTMVKHAAWGQGDWGLNNEGDEVVLLNGADLVVDLVAYGTGSYPTVIAHPGVTGYGHTLQRYPAWLDTDDCRVDFRDWPYSSPGTVP